MSELKIFNIFNNIQFKKSENINNCSQKIISFFEKYICCCICIDNENEKNIIEMIKDNNTININNKKLDIENSIKTTTTFNNINFKNNNDKKYDTDKENVIVEEDDNDEKDDTDKENFIVEEDDNDKKYDTDKENVIVEEDNNDEKDDTDKENVIVEEDDKKYDTDKENDIVEENDNDEKDDIVQEDGNDEKDDTDKEDDYWIFIKTSVKNNHS